MNSSEFLSQVNPYIIKIPSLIDYINDVDFVLMGSVVKHFDETLCVSAEAVQRAATIAEAEGVNKIEATHLERILPQLLLDF